MVDTTRRQLSMAALSLPVLASAPGVRAQSGPIRIGSTLGLTGPLSGASTAQKIASEIFVEGLNKRGGLLGRPVEWIVRDDQSKPDVARTLYEQLITVDKVDLLMGPYGTGAILSSMAVAQRYGKMLIHNTFGLPALAKYESQFSVSGSAYDIESVWPGVVFDAVASAQRPPRNIAVLASKFPSVHFVTQGARQVMKSRGLNEAIYLEWEFGNRDFGAIAARVKDTKPDMVWVGGLGLEGNMLLDAMRKIGYTPPMTFVMFPAPGPMAKSPDGQGVMALTVFEEHAPFTNNAIAAEFIKIYGDRAAKAGMAETSVDLFASVAFASWQVLEAAVNGTRSLDDKALSAWIKRSQADTIIGRMRWDGTNNFIKGKDLYKVKQVNNGKWQVVWPPEFAAPGARVLGG